MSQPATILRITDAVSREGQIALLEFCDKLIPDREIYSNGDYWEFNPALTEDEEMLIRMRFRVQNYSRFGNLI